jgi:hypothetical protein
MGGKSSKVKGGVRKLKEAASILRKNTRQHQIPADEWGKVVKAGQKLKKARRQFKATMER